MRLQVLSKVAIMYHRNVLRIYVMEQLLNVMKHSQDMFIERGFTVKESKECGAGGSMVRY